MYKNVAKNIEKFTLQVPNTVVPTPTNEDYELGFIYRYFIQKANDEDSFIYEINLNEYNLYNLNPFWKKLRLKWRITGPINPTYNNGTVSDRGVIQSNKSSLNIASSQFKNISLYLPNLLQFYK
jgi:hypothetical protein